jgi:hypothetical protein
LNCHPKTPGAFLYHALITMLLMSEIDTVISSTRKDHPGCLGSHQPDEHHGAFGTVLAPVVCLSHPALYLVSSLRAEIVSHSSYLACGHYPMNEWMNDSCI